jgi:hypothetical protein
MLQKGVLTHEKMVEIRSLQHEYKKNDALLEWLINHYKGGEGTIFELLENAGQKHIVNYITANGRMFCSFRLFTLTSHSTVVSFITLMLSFSYLVRNFETIWYFCVGRPSL